VRPLGQDLRDRIEVTGDPDRPIEKVVHKRRLGEPAPKRPR
jgi:hypothetical protein